jgi:ribA/ribD-fused uncharacterized protein
MREKWRKLGSPQHPKQRFFVINFFEPIYFYRAYKIGPYVGFSNASKHPVTTDLGTFPTSEAAFQAYKDPTNHSYIEKQKTSTGQSSKNLGKTCKLRDDWDDVKIPLMHHVLKLKIEQHQEIKNNLLNTYLRPLIEHTKTDLFWGDGGDGTGKNHFGKLLSKIRNKLLLVEDVDTK